MKKYLISEGGTFYKANLHCHTTFSDGRLTPAEVKELYKSHGYSVVAYTDHDILIPHDELTDSEFLALHGFEVEFVERISAAPYHKKQCHVCFIGLEPENITQPCWNEEYARIGNAPKNAHLVVHDESQPPYEQVYSGECIGKMMQTAREKGFFVTYNHPSWSLARYTDYMSYNGMHAMEMYNSDCTSAGFLDYNPRVYDDMLMGGKRIYCIGTDDNHNAMPHDSRKSDFGRAWTMIKAESLAYRDITRALEAGNFYASEGPEIHELCFENGNITVKCSEADKIICTFGCRRAAVALNEDYSPVTEASFKMDPDWNYFRITVVDKYGKTACTNAYFADGLF